MAVLVAVASFALATACAPVPPRQSAQLAQPPGSAGAASLEPRYVKSIEVEPELVTGDTLVCREEARLGRHIKRERCYTRKQLEEMRRDAQLWLRTGGRQGYPRVAR